MGQDPSDRSPCEKIDGSHLCRAYQSEQLDSMAAFFQSLSNSLTIRYRFLQAATHWIFPVRPPGRPFQ